MGLMFDVRDGAPPSQSGLGMTADPTAYKDMIEAAAVALRRQTVVNARSRMVRNAGSRHILPLSKQRAAVGRNAPCPCGSKKKFKRCCLKR